MRVIISVVLILSINCCYSQQFSLLYDYENYSNDGTSIVEINSDYYSTHAATNLSTWKLTTLVTKHNSNNQLSWDSDLTIDSNVFAQAVFTGRGIIYEIPNDFFLVLTTHYTNVSGERSTVMFKFDYFGEILDTIFLDYQDLNNLVNYSGTNANDALYLLCQPAGTSQVVIVKLYYDGSYIQHWQYHIGYAFAPKFIEDVGDGLVIGGLFMPNPNIEFWLQYVRKLDYLGNIQWTNIIDNNGLSSRGAVNALPMDNGNVLFAATATSGVPLTERFRPMIGEIDDATGDTLWTRKYFSTDSIYELYNFKRLSTGEYIGVGEAWYPFEFPGGTYVPMGFIFKLDSEYNLLWKRNYAPEGFAGIVFPHPTCRLNDFVENEDGGVTALGRAFTYTGTGPQSGYIQDSWLLRVDSEGCLVSGCAVDITEHENQSYLFVYPNPANQQLNIQFPYIDKWQVSIYNMQGALVREESANQLLQYTVDVHELHSGIYTVLCRDGKGKVFSEKVIKQ